MRTYNYYCTWTTQNYVAKNSYDGDIPKHIAFLGDFGAQFTRSQLNEEALFGENGWCYQFPEDVRKDLILVLDDGWDVEYGIHPDKNRHLFGSLEISKERFPLLKGDNAERLKQMCEKIKNAGWKGTGIWVSAQMAGENWNKKPLDREMHEKYWCERLEWSKFAGVAYWKVDWGTFSQSKDFRLMLTNLAREIYPELIVEHAFCYSPLNGNIKNGDKSFLQDERAQKGFKEIFEISEVYRSYDVTDQLSPMTTLDRVAFLLQNEGGIVNCEDEVYIAASLGCAIGIMRSAHGAEYSPQCKRMDEIPGAVRFLKIAPPFAGGKTVCSERILEESYLFKEGDTWCGDAIGRTVTQSAPAVVARNMPLPEVECENPPYVMSSKNPNGVYAVAAVRRSCSDLPKVNLKLENPEKIGVFGTYKELSLQFDGAEKVEKITFENLIDGKIYEKDAKIENGKIIIDGKTLNEIHTSKDESESAIIISAK